MPNNDCPCPIGEKTSRECTSEKSSGGQTPNWESPIIRDDSGDPIGVSLFLTASDLRKLGLPIEEIDIISYELKDQDCILIHNPPVD